MTIKKRRRGFGRKAAAAVCAVLLSAALAVPAGAQSVSISPYRITGRDTDTYHSVPILADGKSVQAYLINDTSMVAFRAFYETFLPECKIGYNAQTRTATVTASRLSVQVTDGSHLLYANGRCLYADTPMTILDDGRLYVPIRLLAKTLELSVEWDGEARRVYLAGEPTPLLSGSEFYDADELYWLSRIISAESRGEPFIGQVAVGNVVLNRVACPNYPNTVYGVIFDRKYGVQFSPILDGSIWQTPHSASVTAAKVCLEGYTVSEDILYFVDPAIAQSHWVENNRPYAFRILNHAFYY